MPAVHRQVLVWLFQDGVWWLIVTNQIAQFRPRRISPSSTRSQGRLANGQKGYLRLHGGNTSIASRGEGQPFTLEPYDAFVQRAGLKAGQLPHPGLSAPLQDLQAAMPEAVARMRQHMMQRQAAFATQMQQRLQVTLMDLERLQAAQVQQLAWRLEKQLEQVRQSQFEQHSRVIRRVFDAYRQRVEDTPSTEPEPYPQVLAAVCG